MSADGGSNPGAAERRRQELFRLFGAISDGTIDEADHQRLQALLASDSRIRRLWFIYNDLEVGLDAWAAARTRPAPVGSGGAVRTAANGPPARERATPARSRGFGIPRPRPRSLAMAAAAVLAVVAFAVPFLPSGASAPAAFAMLSGEIDARWGDDAPSRLLAAGALPAGLVHLVSGSAQFAFASGATVVIQGPAAFALRGPRRIEMQAGKVLCRCPLEPSRLTVATPAMEVTDLGTEFVVDAGGGQTTRLAVIHGEVLVARDGQRFRMRTGQTLAVSQDGRVEYDAPFRDRFLPIVAVEEAEGAALPVGANLLADPGFEATPLLRSAPVPGVWHGTANVTALVPGRGRAGTVAARIASAAGLTYPLIGQLVVTGDIGGREVRASVWVAQPHEDPVRGRQDAILKLTFRDHAGHYAWAQRRLPPASAGAEHFVQSRLTAVAPPGTDQVLFEVLVNSAGRSDGAILVDDAALTIADPAAARP